MGPSGRVFVTPTFGRLFWFSYRSKFERSQQQGSPLASPWSSRLHGSSRQKEHGITWSTLWGGLACVRWLSPRLSRRSMPFFGKRTDGQARQSGRPDFLALGKTEPLHGNRRRSPNQFNPTTSPPLSRQRQKHLSLSLSLDPGVARCCACCPCSGPAVGPKPKRVPRTTNTRTRTTEKNLAELSGGIVMSLLVTEYVSRRGLRKHTLGPASPLARARQREDSWPLPGPGSRKGWRCASLSADPRSLTVGSLSGVPTVKSEGAFIFYFSGSLGTLPVKHSVFLLPCCTTCGCSWHTLEAWPTRRLFRLVVRCVCHTQPGLLPERVFGSEDHTPRAESRSAAHHDGAGSSRRLVLASPN